jgi:hypothetical protein
LLLISWITTSNYTCLQKNTKQQTKEGKKQTKEDTEGR